MGPKPQAALFQGSGAGSSEARGVWGIGFRVFGVQVSRCFEAFRLVGCRVSWVRGFQV